jgi:hypothetical protein
MSNKNTTLGRKAGNTMHKNEGTSHEPRRRDQAGDGADFAFNGQMGDGVNRAGNRYAGNAHSHLVGNPDKINEGERAFARTGNHSDQSVDRMERV